MPFVANTPESFVDRSDSKNPSSTCRGITSNGRPCRRPVAATVSPTRSRIQAIDPRDESLYCWQHKEQASYSAVSSPGPRGTATPILEEHRTSLDTLADRLGLVDLQEKQRYSKQHRPRRDERRTNYNGGGRPARPAPKPKQASMSFCCFSVPIEQVSEKPTRPQPRPVQRTSAPMPSGARTSKPQLSAASSPSKNSRKSITSQTARLKDLIPDTLDTLTASALMAELARPYVTSEEEGYIYMFWLTPASSAPPVDAARALLAPPSPSPRSRRASDVVSSFADTDAPFTKNKTMLLKIGRAANVQRRMNQWQRQCGRDIEVLRYYPYAPTSNSSTSIGSPPRKTPHAHRVERLIHIELSGMGLRVAGAAACSACGREHREWFQVEAARGAVREVDAVIRRWIEWDEANG